MNVEARGAEEGQDRGKKEILGTEREREREKEGKREKERKRERERERGAQKRTVQERGLSSIEF